MHPILFRLPDFIPLVGGFGVHTYGVMVALGFLVGMLFIQYESRRVGLNVEMVMDLFFYLVIAGLVGSRILYVFAMMQVGGYDFSQDPLMFFRVWEGGLVFQGGVIACVLVTIWFTRKNEIPFMKVADVFTPALALGHAFGRIGCLFAGCCFGRQCDLHFPLALTFPVGPDTIAPSGIPLYPTQLMEASGEVAIFMFLLLYRNKKSFDGTVFLLYLILYSILRSTVEIFRGDTVRGFVVEPYVSNGQFISLLAIVAAVFAWVYLAKKARQKM